MQAETLYAAKKIVETLVDSALSKGYLLSVSFERGYDVDEMLLKSGDRDKILAEATSLDDCHLFIHDASAPAIEDGRVRSYGWVSLIPVNGVDVISDYSANRVTEDVVKAACELAESMDQ